MKVILVNPAMNYKVFGQFARFMQPMPPLGLAYLAAVLEKEGHSVSVIDNFALGMNVEQVEIEIRSLRPDVVGISCLTPSAPEVFALARAIKDHAAKTGVILGNIHASVFADEILKDEAVDFIVHGEGEFSFPLLLRELGGGRNYRSVDGISFRENGETIHTAEAVPVENLDSLPFPSWKYFPYRRYGMLPFMDLKKPCLSMLSSRGCPYRCVFCCLFGTGTVFRSRNPLAVADEMEYLIKDFSVRQIGFVDPAFALSKENASILCGEIIKRGIHKKLDWICETRVDLVDTELLHLMRKAGCRRILYGIESGSGDTLKKSRKNFRKEQVIKAIAATRKSGIQTSGLFMLGLPGETKKMAEETIRFSLELGLDFAKFAITVPYPGSKLYEDLRHSDTPPSREWDQYVTFNTDPAKLVCLAGPMSPEELIKMQKKAHLSFYLRPGLILRQLCGIRSISLPDLLRGLQTLLTYGSGKKK